VACRTECGSQKSNTERERFFSLMCEQIKGRGNEGIYEASCWVVSLRNLSFLSHRELTFLFCSNSYLASSKDLTPFMSFVFYNRGFLLWLQGNPSIHMYQFFSFSIHIDFLSISNREGKVYRSWVFCHTKQDAT